MKPSAAWASAKMKRKHMTQAAQELVTREEAQLPATYPDPMVSMIERVVMDPTIPIDRLKEVLAMKERLEDRALENAEREAKKAYFAAMSRCQAELPVVTKRQKNSHTNSKYADLAAIEREAMPIVHKHGFAVSFQPDGYNEKGELRVLWEISHEDGHSRNGVGEIPIDGAGSQGKVNKTGTQAFGSTATYGRRYLLCMLFNISTGDDRDGNAPSKQNAATADIGEDGEPRTITEAQVAELQQAIVETGTNIAGFLKWMNVERLEDIESQFLKNARDALDLKRKKQ